MQKNKPSHTLSIVHVKAGETIPPSFLATLLDENKSAIGFAVQEPNGLVVEKFPQLDTPEKTALTFRGILDNTKKYSRVFAFHAFPPEFDEDEVQPFNVIKDSKGNTILSICVEGIYPNHLSGEYTEAFNFLQDYLGPKVEELYALVGNNPEKLIEKLKTKLFETDILNAIGHRGVVQFLPSKGDEFHFGKNDIGGVYPWGHASLAYGYEEKVEASPAEAAAATHTPKTSKYASADPAPVEPPKKEEPIIKDDNGIHHIEPKPASKPPKVDPKETTDPIQNAADGLMEEYEWSPPANVHGKRLKQAYRGVTGGVLPNNWEQRPTIKLLRPVKVGKAKAETAIASQMKTAEAVKTAEAGELPVISGTEQAGLREFVKKHLDSSSRVIHPPLEIQKMEAKLPNFTELAAIPDGLDDVDLWSPAAKLALIKTRPDSAWLLLIQYGADRRARKQMVAQGDKTLGELTGTEADTTTAPETPATPIPTSIPETPAVHKKSKYA